ncbi:LolA family protein [Natrinema salinisoli]|uniref:LolA family protein n=1 Tax=Natrinema salinisoli TaxID=2878535 RepID=UPI001CEFB47D|nr:DUF2092 domain-containing protein [Natrinema salinisoli]
MTFRGSTAVLIALVVCVLLSGCAVLEPSVTDPDPNQSNPDPEVVFEGAFVHAEDLEDVRGKETTEVTNGSETITEVVRVAERPYVDYRSGVLESSEPDQVGDIYGSNASGSWWYDAASETASYYEAEERFDNDDVRSARADEAERQLELYDLEYRGTERIADREAHVLAVEAKNETVERGISAIVGDTEYVYAIETSDPSDDLEAVEQTLWIDTEYDYPLKERVVFEEPDGERIVMTERFDSVAFNVGLEDERFDPPENATTENSTAVR